MSTRKYVPASGSTTVFSNWWTAGRKFQATVRFSNSSLRLPIWVAITGQRSFHVKKKMIVSFRVGSSWRSGSGTRGAARSVERMPVFISTTSSPTRRAVHRKIQRIFRFCVVTITLLSVTRSSSGVGTGAGVVTYHSQGLGMTACS